MNQDIDPGMSDSSVLVLVLVSCVTLIHFLR